MYDTKRQQPRVRCEPLETGTPEVWSTDLFELLALFVCVHSSHTPRLDLVDKLAELHAIAQAILELPLKSLPCDGFDPTLSLALEASVPRRGHWRLSSHHISLLTAAAEMLMMLSV